MCAEESAAEVCSGLLAPVEVGNSSASVMRPAAAPPAPEWPMGAEGAEEERVEEQQRLADLPKEKTPPK